LQTSFRINYVRNKIGKRQGKGFKTATICYESVLIPVILTTWETEIRRIAVGGQLGQKVSVRAQLGISGHLTLCLTLELPGSYRDGPQEKRRFPAPVPEHTQRENSPSLYQALPQLSCWRLLRFPLRNKPARTVRDPFVYLRAFQAPFSKTPNSEQGLQSGSSTRTPACQG
jgi:hypothetical protein